MADLNEKNIHATIAAHANQINDLTRQRDEFVVQANARILEINTALVQHEGAIMALRALVPTAPAPPPAPRGKRR